MNNQCRKSISKHINESKVYFDRTPTEKNGTIRERCYSVDATDGEEFVFGDIELFYGPYCKEGFVSFSPEMVACVGIETIEQIFNRMKEIEKERVEKS